MKFICLSFEEKLTGALDRTAGDEVGIRQGARGQNILSARNVFSPDYLIADILLQPASSAITLRLQNGAATVTPGPSGISDSAIRRVLLLEARDLNRAIAVAAAHPAFRDCCFEIRAVSDECTVAT